MNQCYLKLNTKTQLKDSLLEFATKPETAWIRKNAFDIAMVPKSLIIVDGVISNILTKFNVVPIIFRMQPWQFYRFHTDAARSCALNLLLDGTDSQTYYGENTDCEEVMNINELVYDDRSFYLLNTHVKHAVINRNNTRYMFSMGFSDYSYNEIAEFCQANNL